MSNTNLTGLSAALDESSKVNRNLALIFVSFCIFLFVFNMSVEDVMILLPDMFRVHIPIVDMKVTLKGIYIITPLIMLFFHYNLLQNISHHDAKLEHWTKAVTKENHFRSMHEIIEEKEKYLYPFIYNYSILHREEICDPTFTSIKDEIDKRAYLKECLNSRFLIQLFVFILPLIVLSIMFIQTIKFGSLTLHFYYMLTCVGYYYFIVIRFSRKLSLDKIDVSEREERGKGKWNLKYIRKQLRRSIIPNMGARYRQLRSNWRETFNNLPIWYNKWTFNWRFFLTSWINIGLVIVFFWNFICGILFITKTWKVNTKVDVLYEGSIGFRYHLKVANEQFDNPALAADYYSYHFYSKKNIASRKLIWTDLRNSKLKEFDFNDVHFYRCNLKNTDFSRSKFTNCKWTPSGEFSRLQIFNNCTFDPVSFERLLKGFTRPNIDTITKQNDKLSLVLNQRDTIYISYL